MRIFLLSLIFLVGCSNQYDYLDDHPMGDHWMFHLIRLQIVPTFESPVIYEVTNGEPYNLYITTYEGQGGYDWGNIQNKSTVELTKEEYDGIIEALEVTLENYPLKDQVGGKDGSSWVLESSKYQYVKLSAWLPTYKTKERGYSAFVRLRDILAKISARKNA